MTEAEFLAAVRALPLHPGALGLRDDAARLGRLVLTSDTLVEGVHYLASDPPGDVAWKLVATNLSDLAAKGAVPVGVMLNYPLRLDPPSPSAVPDKPSPARFRSGREPDRPGTGLGVEEVSPSAHSPYDPIPAHPLKESGLDWDTAFLAGLAEALTAFAAPILGGDTVSLPRHAPRVITLTAIGDSAHAPARNGAQAGDALYVTGTIGDAGAGLAIARGQPGPAELLAAYRRPQPQLAAGQALGGQVSAMMDVSDGLLIDAQRLAAASGLAVAIDLAQIPLSAAYRTHVGDTRAARLAAATAGDDYQLLFALAPHLAPAAPATRIGVVSPGAGLTLHEAGAPLGLPATLGYQHAG